MGKKKEKITYIDDGRTIADMRGVTPSSPLGRRNPYQPSPKAKEVWKTYWSAVKMMFVPMLVVVCALIIIYMLMSLIFLLV